MLREALKTEREERRSELEKKSKELENSFHEDTNRLKQIIKKATNYSNILSLKGLRTKRMNRAKRPRQGAERCGIVQNLAPARQCRMLIVCFCWCGE